MGSEMCIRDSFITVPWEFSTRQPGRVEWLPEATTLWDRIRLDRPLGSLRDGSIGVGDVDDATEPPTSTAGTTPAAPPSSTSSVGTDPNELQQAGLCT